MPLSKPTRSPHMRKPNATLCPKAAQAAWNNTPQSAPTQITICCKLITPMYGGGVTAGEVDCKMPIRASALRGQLRFWWRLLKATSYPNSKALFKAECDLWGGISSTGPKASQVTLQIKGSPVRSRDLIESKLGERLRNEFDYVLILDRSRRENPMLLEEGYEFKLILSFNSATPAAQKAEVKEALRWWLSFGGVGARTRRGLGAVEATSCNPVLKPVSGKEVKAKGGRMVLRPAVNNAVGAWRDAVKKLKEFRQGPRVGRNPGPGRSYWPEPDAIRRSSQTWAPQHPPQHLVDAYPRAAFGLPIVFHFKDRGDPPDHTLKPDRPDRPDSDRMASPLILRPYFDGQQYCPLALLLPGWEGSVSVRICLNNQPKGKAWPINPATRSADAAQVPPMNGCADDALSAFIVYFPLP